MIYSIQIPACIGNAVQTDEVMGNNGGAGASCQVSDPHLDLSRAPYVLYGVNYIDLVSLDVCSGHENGDSMLSIEKQVEKVRDVAYMV